MILLMLEFTISASGRTNRCPGKSGAAQNSNSSFRGMPTPRSWPPWKMCWKSITDHMIQPVSCPRFSWTPICPTGGRYGEFHMWTAPSSQGVLQCFDQIACVHMSGLLVRSHMNAGQDGFRDKSSKQHSDLIEGHWIYRSVPRRGSIDHTICSLSCKFWHRLSTVAVELLPVSG